MFLERLEHLATELSATPRALERMLLSRTRQVRIEASETQQHESTKAVQPGGSAQTPPWICSQSTYFGDVGGGCGAGGFRGDGLRAHEHTRLQVSTKIDLSKPSGRHLNVGITSPGLCCLRVW